MFYVKKPIIIDRLFYYIHQFVFFTEDSSQKSVVSLLIKKHIWCPGGRSDPSTRPKGLAQDDNRVEYMLFSNYDPQYPIHDILNLFL